jgi:hypothetical protein
MNSTMSTFRQAEATETDREVQRALRVVYERFGSDLGVFFQHVRKMQEQEEKRAKSQANPTKLNDSSSDARDEPAA